MPGQKRHNNFGDDKVIKWNCWEDGMQTYRLSWDLNIKESDGLLTTHSIEVTTDVPVNLRLDEFREALIKQNRHYLDEQECIVWHKASGWYYSSAEDAIRKTEPVVTITEG
jgi:hypothetical protein